MNFCASSYEKKTFPVVSLRSEDNEDEFIVSITLITSETGRKQVNKKMIKHIHEKWQQSKHQMMTMKMEPQMN